MKARIFSLLVVFVAGLAFLLVVALAAQGLEVKAAHQSYPGVLPAGSTSDFAQAVQNPVRLGHTFTPAFTIYLPLVMKNHIPTPRPTPTATSMPTMVLTSPAFEPGGEIPERYGFFRENVSPELSWQNVPAGTQSLALFLEDRDVDLGGGAPFVHWVIYNIPPTATGLPEGVPQDPTLPDGSRQGRNTTGGIGYIGPYPPLGETHHYTFALYALDTSLNLAPGATRDEVLQAMGGHILAQAELAGTYRGVTP